MVVAIPVIIESLDMNYLVILVIWIAMGALAFFRIASWAMADLELAISRGSRHGIRTIFAPEDSTTSSTTPVPVSDRQLGQDSRISDVVEEGSPPY